jgi:catechol 2,3-dioxygenase-like lactoylglutathione lyase family enzyme
VDVTVPDPEETVRFLSAGLGFATVEAVPGAVDVLCDGRYGPRSHQRPLRVQSGAEFSLTSIRFDLAEGIEPAGAAAALAAAGAEVEIVDGRIILRAPGGTRIEVGPPEPALASLDPDPLRPRRLGHVNLMAPDPAATCAFYTQVLGMRLSEQIGEILYFLRFGTEHHNIGVRPGPAATAHHLGFEIAGWERYCPILDRLADNGYAIEYGPGRHGPGRNLFAYLRDPSSGLRVELFCDMAHIDEQSGEEPVARWLASDRMTRTLNRWGPQPPESFL